MCHNFHGLLAISLECLPKGYEPASSGGGMMPRRRPRLLGAVVALRSRGALVNISRENDES